MLDEDEIVDGRDELGVLLYGHARNAYWYGSQLTIEEARAARSAPERDRVCRSRRRCWPASSGRSRTRRRGSSRPTTWTTQRCLEVQRPYLGTVAGFYTDWTPLADRPGLFDDDIDPDDPWQFRNVLVH